MSTNLNPQVANAKLMARYAVAFNIGADILNKGSRAIDKYLGAEMLSGDTVNVPIWDSGKVFGNMDLTGKDLSVERNYVPVTVKPLVTASSLTIEDLTLSVKSPEHMVKRVAKQADTANLIAFRTLVEQSQAHVVPNGLTNYNDIANAVRYATFAASATTEGSKLGGQTFGCAHPMTWKYLIASLATNFAPNDTMGKKLYTSELGDYMGYKWCKGSDMSVITARLQASTFGQIILTNGSNIVQYSTDPMASAGTAGSYGSYVTDGFVTEPFTVAGLNNCDALGIPTGELKTLRMKYRADFGDWVLTAPLYWSGARQNCAITSQTLLANPTDNQTVATAYVPQLASGVQYFSPAVTWKESDFLVAVKGLEKFAGCDSFTIPTEYKDKGILPLRGTVFTDPVKASTLFRVDVLLGTAMYQGISAASAYIPVMGV